MTVAKRSLGSRNALARTGSGSATNAPGTAQNASASRGSRGSCGNPTLGSIRVRRCSVAPFTALRILTVPSRPGGEP